VIKQDVVDRALELISKRDVNQAAFFDSLSSPAWIEPLVKAGFFSLPPALQRDGDWIRFPIWPESRYLRRVAAAAPDEVVKLIRGMEATDNARVHEDYADIACEIDASLADAVATAEIKWISEQPQLYLSLSRKYSSLVAHLANGDRADTALKLAEAALKVTGTEDGEITGLVHPWDYDQALRSMMPALVDATGQRALAMLARLLAKGLEGSRHGAKPKDYSFIWRREIDQADDERERSGDVRQALVSSLRDAGDRFLSTQPSEVAHVVRLLEAQEWTVFRRLALYFLIHHGASNLPLIEERLSDESVLENLGVRHELLELLALYWKRLTGDAKSQILAWIERPSGDEPSGDVNEYEERRVLGWLSAIGGALEGEPAERYQQLLTRYGVGHFLEATSGITTRWGSTSPKTALELNQLTIDEVGRFLRDWKPGDGFDDPSVDGLQNALSEAVGADPLRFSSGAEALQGIDAAYLTSMFYGLRQAVRDGKPFDWEPVLSLAISVVLNSSRDPSIGDDARSARRAIVDLVGSGLETGACAIPRDLRTQVWNVIHPLTNDAEPTPDYEEQYGGSNMDPITLSINATRSQAIHATVKYALWIRRDNDRGAVPQGFNDIPEVRETLERHLDGSIDRSEAVRSVYGQWTPWLVPLDRTWFLAWKRRIYPHRGANSHLWHAAWEGYVIANPPYSNVFPLLRGEYSLAVSRLREIDPERRYLADPRDRLGEHLMTLFWSNHLTMRSALLRRFFGTADAPVRKHAATFLGRSLGSAGVLNRGLATRLRRLWSNRVETNRWLPQADRAELSAFGWWFASGKLGDAWSMAMLEESLRLYSKTEVAHLVVKRLATLAPLFPVESVRCLGLLADGDAEGWEIDMWYADASTVLASALAVPAAEPLATQLANDLGARGFTKFLGLLGSPEDSPA
jgi:hypothetical protein